MSRTIAVDVTMRYRMNIDLEHRQFYPSAIFDGSTTDEEVAQAMARFDAEESDEPIDVYVSDSTFVSTAVASNE